MATPQSPNLPEGIGPHEYRELELLLAGTKPLARLHTELSTGYADDITAFEPHVASGRLIRVDVPSSDGLIITHYFCLPTEEWRIKLMETMRTIWAEPGHNGYTVDDYSRIEGTLLGYTKEDIETFVAHWNRNK